MTDSAGWRLEKVGHREMIMMMSWLPNKEIKLVLAVQIWNQLGAYVADNEMKTDAG